MQKVIRVQVKEGIFSSMILVHKVAAMAIPFHSFLISVTQLPWLLKLAGLCSVVG